jgi:hypothetical protein
LSFGDKKSAKIGKRKKGGRREGEREGGRQADWQAFLAIY